MRALFLLSFLFALPAAAQERDMSKYAEVQHLVLPAGVVASSTVERVPLQAAFDLVVPRASFNLLNKLQSRLTSLLERVNEIKVETSAYRRFRYSVKTYNFEVWLTRVGGRTNLYIATEKAPYGGGIEVPMVPYYPSVEVPELVVGEPAYFPLSPRKLRGELIERGEKLEGQADRDRQTRFAQQVFRAAQEYNGALEFLDQPDLEEGQLKIMAQRAERAAILFATHAKGYDARHLLAEVVFERAALDGGWSVPIRVLRSLVTSQPPTEEPEKLLRYQRALYRLGRALYEQNVGDDLEAAARRFHQAGRQWKRDILDGFQARVDSMAERGAPGYSTAAADLESSRELASAAEIAELETRILTNQGTGEEGLVRSFLTMPGPLADIARYRLGTRLYQTHNYDLAAPLLKAAYDAAPSLAHEQPAMGVIVAESMRIVGDGAAAEKLIRRVLELDDQEFVGGVAGRFDPDAAAFAFALVRLGDYEWKSGDATSARARYSRAVKRFPKTEGGFLARVRLVEVTGEIQAEDFPLEVYRRLQSAVSRVSDSSAEESMYREARARFLRGEYHLAHEKLLQLEDEFPKGFLLNSNNGLLDRVRLSLMEQRATAGEWTQVAEAFLLAGSSIDTSPVGARTLFLGGQAFNAVGVYDEAVAVLQRALATHEVRQDGFLEERVLVQLSTAYLRKLDLFRARQTLDYQEALFPKGQYAGEMWLLRGEVEEIAKRPDRAITAYREASKRLRSDLALAMVLLRVGRLESARGAPASAAAAYRRAIERFDRVETADQLDGQVDALFEMGDAFYRLRNWRQAARAYDMAMAKTEGEDDRNAMARYRIGNVRAILGDLAGALQDWKVLAASGRGIWQSMASSAVEDLTWRLRHDGLLSQGR